MNLVETILVAATVDMQERFMKLLNEAPIGFNVRAKLMEFLNIGDELIFSCGLGPEDWGDFEIENGLVVMKNVNNELRVFNGAHLSGD